MQNPIFVRNIWLEHYLQRTRKAFLVRERRLRQRENIKACRYTDKLNGPYEFAVAANAELTRPNPSPISIADSHETHCSQGPSLNDMRSAPNS